MRVYLKRDCSAAKDRSIFYIQSSVKSAGNTIKAVYIDKNKVPECLYQNIYGDTAIIFQFNVPDITVEAEVS
jgi:hypothetical protein